jgi:hypothetical protein
MADCTLEVPPAPADRYRGQAQFMEPMAASGKRRRFKPCAGWQKVILKHQVRLSFSCECLFKAVMLMKKNSLALNLSKSDEFVKNYNIENKGVACAV